MHLIYHLKRIRKFFSQDRIALGPQKHLGPTASWLNKRAAEKRAKKVEGVPGLTGPGIIDMMEFPPFSIGRLFCEIQHLFSKNYVVPGPQKQRHQNWLAWKITVFNRKRRSRFAEIRRYARRYYPENGPGFIDMLSFPPLDIPYLIHRFLKFFSKDRVYLGPQKHLGFFGENYHYNRELRKVKKEAARTPWKRHTRWMNPIPFKRVSAFSLKVAAMRVKVISACLVMLMGLIFNYTSPIFDYAVQSAYDNQLAYQKYLEDEEARKKAEQDRLDMLTAAGFRKEMEGAGDASLGDIYDKSDHLSRDELELESYNVSDNAVTTNEPLSTEDIRTVLQLTWKYNDGLSEREYRIVKSALLTVGRIPYILGGAQPLRPDYSELGEDDFPIVADEDIVAACDEISGMDCSHWVDYIYLLALNNSLGYCNTDSMIFSQGGGFLKLIAVEDEENDIVKGLDNVRAGDIMVYGHDGSHSYGHAGIFLGYVETDDGTEQMYVHESSAAGNVSLHVGEEFGNNGTSPVFYFRYVKSDGDEIDYDYDILREIQASAGKGSPDDSDDEESTEDTDEDDDDSDDDDSDDDSDDDDDDDSDDDKDDSDDDDDDDDDDDSDDDDDDDDDDEEDEQKEKDEDAENYEPSNPESSDTDPEESLDQPPQVQLDS